MVYSKTSPVFRLFGWIAAFPLVGCALTAADVSVEVVHPTMVQRIGYPAIIAPGGELPSWILTSAGGGVLEGALRCSETDEIRQALTPRPLTPGEPEQINLTGDLPPEGVYRLDLRIRKDDTIAFRATSYFSVLDIGALPDNVSRIAHPGPHGRMRYIPDVRGNRIPDFSGVGYRGGAELPHVPTVLRLEPEPGDATARIQAAIDEVSAREPDAAGFRGALELGAGLYEVGGTLHIRHSGVVLRGVGSGPIREFKLDPEKNLSLEEWRASMEGTEATVLVATGPEHRAIIRIEGPSGIIVDESTATEIVDDYVPVGRRWFHVAEPANFSVGDTIQVMRRGNAAWISYIKMDQIPERPGGPNPDRPMRQWVPFNLYFQYTITDVDGDRITVDSGLVSAIEQRWGGGQIRRYAEGGRIREVGVENLRGVSFWQIDENGNNDTRHADQFVFFNHMRDGWVQNVAAEHFTANVRGTFLTGRDTTGVTFLRSSALAPDRSFFMGEGYDPSGRYHLETGIYVGRYGFHFSGQNGLVRYGYTINMRHAYVVASRVSGPNVFSDSFAAQSLTHSEAHHRWSVGGLYDNVTEERSIALMNRLRFGTGHGWAAANYVAWNTRGTLIAEQPPTAQNWAIGHVGPRAQGPFHQWNLDNYGWSYGFWESHGQHVEPASLYTRQITDR